MPNSSLEFAIEQLTRRLYSELNRDESEQVVAAASRIITFVRELHRHVDPEQLAPVVELRIYLDSSLPESVTRVNSMAELPGLLSGATAGATLIIDEDDSLSFLGQVPTGELEPGVVKYHLEPHRLEAVITGDNRFELDRPPGLISAFATSYYRTLRNALGDYYVGKAKTTRCSILASIWQDPSRTLLSNEPEIHMRRSLSEFLDAYLRDAEPVVFQEQNVDETQPVDIRIQWLDSRRVSLLEVKWLGDSLNDDGTRISTRYRDARALEGYEQTARYLSAERATWPWGLVHAMLVVFDARRRRVRWAGGVATAADSWHYRSLDVDYSSVRIEDEGMEDPVRFFLEPTA